MFGFKKKTVAAPASPMTSTHMREFMYGDLPWSTWCKADAPAVEPWISFRTAREALEERDSARAVAALRLIVSNPDYETRCHAQAWHFLRDLGEVPDDGKRLLGVVIEVGLQGGLDVLGAYADHSARYWNFSGSGIVWEHPDTSVDAEIDALFEASRAVVQQIGPWDKPRLPSPEQDIVRISFLTPSGLHFGQGPMATLSRDALAGPVIHRGVELMEKLITKTQRA